MYLSICNFLSIETVRNEKSHLPNAGTHWKYFGAQNATEKNRSKPTTSNSVSNTLTKFTICMYMQVTMLRPRIMWFWDVQKSRRHRHKKLVHTAAQRWFSIQPKTHWNCMQCAQLPQPRIAHIDIDIRTCCYLHALKPYFGVLFEIRFAGRKVHAVLRH